MAVVASQDIMLPCDLLCFLPLLWRGPSKALCLWEYELCRGTAPASLTLVFSSCFSQVSSISLCFLTVSMFPPALSRVSILSSDYFCRGNSKFSDGIVFGL